MEVICGTKRKSKAITPEMPGYTSGVSGGSEFKQDIKPTVINTR